MKTCSQCGAEKPFEEFSVRRASKDGLSASCKACNKAYRFQYVRSEKGRATAKVYWKSEIGKAVKKRHAQSEKGRSAKKVNSKRYRNSEVGRRTIRAYTRQGYVKQRRHEYRISERGRLVRRSYERSGQGKAAVAKYLAKPEVKSLVLKRSRRYYASELGLAQGRKKANRRRAILAGATIMPVDERRVYDFCNNRCVYCGSTQNLTLDHIVPLACGGPHTEENLLVACKSCNSSKGAKPLGEWLATRVRTHSEVALIYLEEAV